MTKNTALFERAERLLPGGNTRTTLFVPPHAPYAAQGEGAHITDADGHRVIDCNNNYTALIHGHRHPAVMASVDQALAKGTAFGLPTETEIDLAAELAVRLPAMNQWRFVNSGTEAVMQAIRIARAYTGKDLLIRFTGSYHGTADAVVDAAAPGVPTSISASVISVPVGDREAYLQAMRENEGRVAAVLLDLMPNRAGLRPAEPDFVDLIRRTTTDAGALLIFDEVITFRMGYGGLQELYAAGPDLTTLGKLIGGGFPVGAVGGRRDVMAKTNPSLHDSVAWGGTFSANPITMAAGLAALKEFDTASIHRLNARGDAMRKRFTAAGVRCTGQGSLIRLFPEDMNATWWKAYESGILLGTNGLIALSTAMDDEILETIADRTMEIMNN